jgi:hypothetical protein
MRVKSVCLTADCFAFGELLGKTPQVTKGVCSWLGSSCVGIPSLRRRSVGPRRTDIHVLTALSPHPCGSAHCALSAFGQRPSRVLRRLDVLRMKIKSALKRIKGFPAEAGPTGVRGAFSGTGFSREERLPNGRLFRLRRVTWKNTPSNQGCLLLAWFLLRRNTLTPTTLRGPAPNGHPCPNGALAGSMRLGPLRVVCFRPAPKSRFASSGRLAYEDQKRI